MAYRDDILALSPDHYWTFDGNHNDIAGVLTRDANQAGGNTAPATGAAITEDASASMHVNSFVSRSECADSTYMNQSARPERTYGGWFMPLEVARPPSAIFKEGGGTNNFGVLLGFGNVLLSQSVDRDDHDVQCYSDKPLKPNRAYHYISVFKASDSTSANNGYYILYVDGVEQSVTNGNPFDTTTMAGHIGDIDWGDPDVNLNTGGTSIGYAAALGYHAHFASWTTVLTPQQIRVELFEKGVKPTHIVTSQADMDALSGQVFDDLGCAVRVVSNTDITLDVNNITFKDCSIDIQFDPQGTNSTLTLVNQNSNTAIVSNPWGGSIEIFSSSSLTINNLPSGTEVTLFDASDDSVIYEVENASGIVVINYQANEINPVNYKLRVHNPLYGWYPSARQPFLFGTLVSSQQTISVTMELNENFIDN